MVSEIETVILEAVRKQIASRNGKEQTAPIPDRNLIERHVVRVIVKSQELEVHVRMGEATVVASDHGAADT